MPYSTNDYAEWLAAHSREEIRKTFGHAPSFSEWADYMTAQTKNDSLKTGTSSETFGYTPMAAAQDKVLSYNYDYEGRQYAVIQRSSGQTDYEYTGGYDATRDMSKSATAGAKPLTYEEASAMVQKLGADQYFIDYDESTGGYTVQRMAAAKTGMSEAEKNRDELERQRFNWEQRQFEAQMAWNREEQQSQLAAQKENRLAQLKANPAAWLEYAALAGQPAAIQPWMLPLMPQQYQSLQPGQAIPGFTGKEGTMSDLPQLTTPSAQYYARISPTARQQYAGYQQARTGATPEDTQWQLWSTAPPGGRNVGLSYAR